MPDDVTSAFSSVRPQKRTSAEVPGNAPEPWLPRPGLRSLRSLYEGREMTDANIKNCPGLRVSRQLMACAWFALTLSMGASLAACADTSSACGEPPALSVKPERASLPDPYAQRRRFVRTVETYRGAVAGTNGANIQGAAWNVCTAAEALSPYTREVAADIRPRFTRALSTTITLTRERAHEPATAVSASDNLVDNALVEFTTAMPRFWSRPAASLRGSRQPGSPLWTHR